MSIQLARKMFLLIRRVSLFQGSNVHKIIISGDGSRVLFIKVSIFQGVLLRGLHCTDPSTSGICSYIQGSMVMLLYTRLAVHVQMYITSPLIMLVASWLEQVPSKGTVNNTWTYIRMYMYVCAYLLYLLSYPLQAGVCVCGGGGGGGGGGRGKGLEYTPHQDTETCKVMH